MPKREIPWDKMRKEYIFTSATVRSLAEKYGCSKRAVDRRSVTEGWVELRRQEMTVIGQEAHARIRARAVADHVRLYDATRAAVDKMVAIAERVCGDDDGFFKHLVQYEKTEQTGNSRDTEKYVEEKVFTVVNSKTYAEIAKGLRDVAMLARVLDGILDAKDAAKNDIEVARLQLDKQRAGMDNDTESECGIALMPAIDMSLLEGALPDPGEVVAG